jgi:hypothetical protein
MIDAALEWLADRFFGCLGGRSGQRAAAKDLCFEMITNAERAWSGSVLRPGSVPRTLLRYFESLLFFLAVCHLISNSCNRARECKIRKASSFSCCSIAFIALCMSCLTALTSGSGFGHMLAPSAS